MRLQTRYYGVAYGYRKGIDIVKDMGGGFLQKLTEGASILGLFVMGALVNKWTHVNIPLVVSRITDQTGKEHVTTVQTILDQLMPGLVPLLLTFACMWLLRKKVNPLWIIVGFFVIGIAGYACRPAGSVRLLYDRGLLAPFFYLEECNDNHGPGTDSVSSPHSWPSRSMTSSSCPAVTARRCWQFLCSGVVALIALSSSASSSFLSITTSRSHGALITTWLLSALALMGFYIFWIRTPKIIFKPRGFFFANVWIEYSRIKEMNLSEDGVLVMQLEQRRLLFALRNIDDLEKIYKLLVSTQ